MQRIILEDESLRDGLQFEAKTLSLEDKLALFKLLAEAGVKRVQVGSFVHPKIVPQMADTDILVERIAGLYSDILITGLVLNEKGLERAMKCGLNHVSMSVSASNTHSQKNAGVPAEEALKRMLGLISIAARSGMKIRAGVQCAFGCVYEGAVDEEGVLRAAEAMAEAGAVEVNLADTTGMAGPVQVKNLVKSAEKAIPNCNISLHLHDTRGLGLVNMMAGYDAGVNIFDVSAGGLGGCPFVKGASGNVATEDAVHLFERLGENTGIDMKGLCAVVEKYEFLLGRRLPGHMSHIVNLSSEKCQ